MKRSADINIAYEEFIHEDKLNRQETIMKRQESNQAIINRLQKMVNEYPEWRFGQILMSIGILPSTIHPDSLWNEESVETLKRMDNFTENF